MKELTSSVLCCSLLGCCFFLFWFHVLLPLIQFFRQQLSRSLRVSEEMFELATSFNIPALYIRLLCEREHQNMVVLQSMVEVSVTMVTSVSVSVSVTMVTSVSVSVS